MKQATLKPQLYLNVFYLLILIFVSCDHKPPFGHIYYPPEDENFTQLAPLNDTSWASVGVRRQIEQHKSDSYFKLMDAQYQTVWERHYEGEDFEMGYKIIPSGDNYILLGLSKFSGERQGDSRVAIVANDGHELWNSIIGGAGDDRLFGGVATPDNGFLFVGSTVRDRSQGFDGWLVKLDNNGKELWTRSFGLRGNMKGDYFSSIQSLTGGGYIISGYSASYGAGRFDAWLVKIDEFGHEEWSRTYGGPGKDYIFKPYLLDDGGFLLYGSTASKSKGQSIGWLFKTDSLGNVIWTQYYKDTSGLKSLVPFRSDGYLLLGNFKESESAENDIWLCRIDMWGNKVWAKLLGGEGSDSGLGLYESSTGYRIIAQSRSFASYRGTWIIHLDSEGSPQ